MSAPCNPIVASASPPSAGPSARVPLLVAESSAIAAATRSVPAIVPIMVRRAGRSVVQKTPPANAMTARCQVVIQSSQAIASMAIDRASMAARPTARVRRVPSRSTTAPVSAPNSVSGSMRRREISDTRRADCVASKT